MERFVGDDLEGDIEDIPRLYSLPGGSQGAHWNGANVGEDYVLLSDGSRLIPTNVKNATYHLRAQLEPGAARYFHALALQWIDRTQTPAFAVNAIEQALRICGVTANPASQRIYRIEIDKPLKSNRTPDFVLGLLVVGRVLRCSRYQSRSV